MNPRSAAAQLRTTDLDRTIRFYTQVLGLELAFRHEDFYAGVRAGGQMIHLNDDLRPGADLPWAKAADIPAAQDDAGAHAAA